MSRTATGRREPVPAFPSGATEIEGKRSLVTNPSMIEYGYDSLEEAFPSVEPGMAPFGVNCIFQIRLPKMRTKGGIIIPDEAQATDYYNTQIGKCITMGPLCFKSLVKTPGEPDKLVPWSDGPWFAPGDFCRLPKYGGDRFAVPHKTKVVVDNETQTITTDVIFAIFKSADVLAKVTCNPLSIKAFLD